MTLQWELLIVVSSDIIMAPGLVYCMSQSRPMYRVNFFSVGIPEFTVAVPLKCRLSDIVPANRLAQKETTSSGGMRSSVGCHYSAGISLYSAHTCTVRGPTLYSSICWKINTLNDYRRS